MKKEWCGVAIVLALVVVMVVLVVIVGESSREEAPVPELAVEEIQPYLLVNPVASTVRVKFGPNMYVKSMLSNGYASLYVLAPGGRGYIIDVTTDTVCPDGVKVGVRYDGDEKIFIPYQGESLVAPSEKGPTQVIIEKKEDCG